MLLFILIQFMIDLSGMEYVDRSIYFVRYNIVEFFANSPFVFFIMGQNQELLFFGRVQNLTEN